LKCPGAIIDRISGCPRLKKLYTMRANLGDGSCFPLLPETNGKPFEESLAVANARARVDYLAASALMSAEAWGVPSPVT
jgi:hypothetical protein